MDGIFGFFGSRDPILLKQMLKPLTHRVGKRIKAIQTNKMSVCYGRSQDIKWQHTNESGLIKINDISLAVCGFFTGKSKKYTLQQLVFLYKKYGIKSFYTLQGSFLIALQDNEKGYLIRDGVGQRTIYYSQQNDKLLFAIEPKGIHQISGFQRQLNLDSVAQYFSFSFVPGYNTMLKDLYELPPGHCLIWNNNKLILHRYYQFEKIKKSNLSEKEYIQNFRDLFSDCVSDRLSSKQNVGVFLSGGLDSSIVAAELANQHDQTIQSFSLHFGKKYPNELDYADLIVKKYHLNHHIVEIQPKNFITKLINIIWHLDDPIGDPITVPNYMLAHYAKNHVNWIFNGEGGDPCFGGPKNYSMLLLHWYGQQRNLFYQEEAYLKIFNRAYTELNKLFSPEFTKLINPEKQLYPILTPFFNSTLPTGYLDKLMAMNIRLKGAHLILPKVDRMLGANGFCSLSPLFDERLVRLSFEIPSTLKLINGDEKIIMKRAYKNKIPNRILTRQKEGMRVPLQFWFKDELNVYLRHILNKKSINEVGIFNYERIQKLMQYKADEAQPRYGMKLWMLLTFEIWRRRVIENEKEF